MDPVLIIGILCGLGAAFFQACSYFASRSFLHHCTRRSRVLFGIGHLQMGIAAFAAFPFLLDGPLPPVSEWWLQLAATSGFYLTAQRLLFLSLKKTDSSVVAPLLGLKIPLLGIISVLFLGDSLPAGAWAAVVLCTAAAFLVSPPRGLPEFRGLLLILLTCLGYCGADIFIPRLVERIAPASDYPILLGVSMTYMVCGVIGVITAWHQKAFQVRHVQRHALPYAVTWLTGMCFLFAAFSTVGVIFGNMLQSTRGLISVMIAALVLRLGWEGLETRTTRRIFWLRLGGAVLMTGAIVLYYLAKLRFEI
ncbi:MAG: EamA family transporter [Lentisphaeria bacterium]